MKAITVIQPWASLIIFGEKRIETRSWRTEHRGRLAIHAGKKNHPAYAAICQAAPFRSILQKHGITDSAELSRGVILGTVHLDDCVMVDLLPPGVPTPLEQAFGDYSPGRYGWLLSQPTPMVVPFSLKGMLGIFDVPEDICEGK